METALMHKKQWHKLSVEEQDVVLKSSMIVGQFMDKYHQPWWCTYPEALAGQEWGCWTLMCVDPDTRIEAPIDCIRCEYYRGVVQ